MKQKPGPLNPVEIAVALRYDGSSAPTVVAKGRKETAEKILTMAYEYDIPLHRDPQLVQVLSHIPLGEEIPRELYAAVAEVIAFAFWLSGRNGPQSDG